MTVDAFLQMDDSTAPMNTLRYSAFAQLANSSTVVHRVHTSTHSDYIGKTLVRDIEFHKNTSKLVLTPREKFLGAAFARLDPFTQLREGTFEGRKIGVASPEQKILI